MQTRPKTGVGGTVDAFNFIRRVAFPTTPQVLLIFAAVATVSAMLALIPAGEGPVQTLGFTFGVMVIPSIVGAIVSVGLLSNHDNVLDFRRLMGMELVALLPLTIILPIVSIIGVVSGARHLWEQGFLIGLALTFPTRFLTALAMSTLSSWRKVGVGIATPVLASAMFLSLTPTVLPDSNLALIVPKVYALVILGIGVSAIGTGLIVRGVEREGTAEIGHSPMGLFRAFLDHWLRKRPDSLEDRLLTLATEGDIETRILGFSGEDSKPKSTIIVSNFHPGPYRDLGSGGLPSEIKKAIEDSRHVVALVPHSISNHKLNIVSHRDIDKLLEAVKGSYPSQHTIETASRMVREQVGEAIVSGQAFGRVALLTITLAPEEMEDLPTEVVIEIDREASNRKLQALTVDSHNSIETQTSITSAQASRIIEAARKVLGTLEILSQERFKIGVAEDSLEPFTLKDGIGPGGLAVMTVETKGQTVAYLTVDGNNMQRGLRDKILKSLRDMGIDDAEVMTTDTHLVTGLVRSRLGYHPVGEHLPTEVFLQRINQTVRTAKANMQDSSTGFSRFSMQLPVLGSEAFNSITGFIGRIARQVGRGFYRLEIICFVLALAVLLV